jgi:hypothetical protein
MRLGAAENMNRRTFLKTVSAAASGPVTHAAARTPNIVLIY